jgi:hypothetical protein
MAKKDEKKRNTRDVLDTTKAKLTGTLEKLLKLWNTTKQKEADDSFFIEQAKRIITEKFKKRPNMAKEILDIVPAKPAILAAFIGENPAPAKILLPEIGCLIEYLNSNARTIIEGLENYAGEGAFLLLMKNIAEAIDKKETYKTLETIDANEFLIEALFDQEKISPAELCWHANKINNDELMCAALKIASKKYPLSLRELFYYYIGTSSDLVNVKEQLKAMIEHDIKNLNSWMDFPKETSEYILDLPWLFEALLDNKNFSNKDLAHVGFMVNGGKIWKLIKEKRRDCFEYAVRILSIDRLLEINHKGEYSEEILNEIKKRTQRDDDPVLIFRSMQEKIECKQIRIILHERISELVEEDITNKLIALTKEARDDYFTALMILYGSHNEQSLSDYMDAVCDLSGNVVGIYSAKAHDAVFLEIEKQKFVSLYGKYYVKTNEIGFLENAQIAENLQKRFSDVLVDFIEFWED